MSDQNSPPSVSSSLRGAGQQSDDSQPSAGLDIDARDYRDRHHAARARRTDTEHAITQAWGRRWSSCEACAALVQARDLYGLIGRVVDAMPARVTRGNRLVRVRGELHGLYAAVFDTLAPGRGRITPGHPLGVWAQPPAGTP